MPLHGWSSAITGLRVWPVQLDAVALAFPISADAGPAMGEELVTSYFASYMKY